MNWDANFADLPPIKEARLGRKLRLPDFTGYPSVEGFGISDTLADRYGFGKEIREKVRKKKARKRVTKRSPPAPARAQRAR